MSDQARLSVEDVGLEYWNPKTGTATLALDGINLAVSPGEFVCIVGPSGCGKTTFLSLVDGLIEPTRGRILLDGRPVTGPGPDRAVVFQSPSLLPWRTVLRNVTYGLELQGVSLRQAMDRARELLRLVGLAGFENHYPHELSGGMQQRVNLARALAVDPELILLDEPFAALDAQTREHMQQELMRIWLERRKTALFITHQINEAVYLADRVVVFTARPGRVKISVPVPFERPRSLELKRTPAFHELEDYLWYQIEEEVRKSRDEHLASA